MGTPMAASTHATKESCQPVAQGCTVFARPRTSVAPTTNFSAWSPLCVGCAAPPGGEPGPVVYDPPAQELVSFGGGLVYGLPGTSNATWVFKNDVWNNVSRAACQFSCPLSRGAEALAYDPAMGSVIMFGGWAAPGDNGSSGHDVNDTWKFDDGVWTQLHPHTSPAPREASGATYDASAGGVLLFGGVNGSVGPGSLQYNDTWIFSGGNWTLLPLSHGPSPRFSMGLAFDPADNAAILFGGRYWNQTTQLFDELSDTWEFAGGAWTELPGPSPGPRVWMSMSYDNATGSIVLFGGYVFPGSSDVNDTWTFQGSTWSPLLPFESPSPRAYPSSSFDPATDALILFGGENQTTGAPFNDTWEFRENSSALSVDLLANPPETDLGRPVQFVSSTSGGFGPISLSIRSDQGNFSFGPTLSCTFVTLGQHTVTVWANDSANEHALFSLLILVRQLPTVSASSTPIPVDAGVGESFVATVAGGDPPFLFDWRFGDGASSSLQDPSHAYAASGSFDAEVWVNDSAGATASAMAPVVVETGLVVTAQAAPNATEVGSPVDFSVASSGGTGSPTLTWTFSDGGRGGGALVSHTFEERGNYTVRVWANDSGGGSADAAVLVRVDPSLSVSSIQASETRLDAGSMDTFTASWWGGLPPYSTDWVLGDGTAATGSAVQHAFESEGTYSVRFTVTDADGDAQTATISVRANPDPTIASFEVTPPMTELGGGVTFVLNATGGTGGLTVVYADAPPGCLELGLTGGQCTPTATGTFEVRATVTDDDGHGVNATTALTVTSASMDRGEAGTGTIIAGGVAAGLIVAAVVWIALRRRREKEDSPPPPPGPGSEARGSPGEAQAPR